MAITLYKMDASPPSRSAHMMLDLLGIEANYVDVNLIRSEQMSPAFRKKNPIHTVPTLDDNGFNIFESNAIATYLADKYAKNDALYPKDIQKRAIVNQRLHFNSGLLFPALQGTTSQILFQGVGKVTDERKKIINDSYRLLEALLTSHNGSWFAGDQLTVADICSMSTVSSMNSLVPLNETKYPKSIDWFKKCSELPTFQKINVPGNESLKIIINARLD